MYVERGRVQACNAIERTCDNEEIRLISSKPINERIKGGGMEMCVWMGQGRSSSGEVPCGGANRFNLRYVQKKRMRNYDIEGSSQRR